ncbi:MAG: hypothetical protein JW873_02310 [Candidatus Saganbacteria bacterium]|nr:hypothetical protein [Candidatus Saganbacteria bacterium]
MTCSKRGQMLVAAIFVIVVFTVLGVELASLLASESYSTIQNYNGVRALNVAEAGVRFTLATSLAATANWSGSALKKFGPVTFSPGTFSITYESISESDVTVKSTGTVNGVSRTVTASFHKESSSLGEFADYNVYAGTPGSVGNTLYIYDTAKIIGDFYYYGPIVIYGTRPPPAQSGGVIKSTYINPSSPGGIPNYYASWEAIGGIDNVVWSNTYYNTMLGKVGTGTSGLYSSKSLANGTWQYTDVGLWGNYSITGPGTICCNGLFAMGSTSKVTGNVDVLIKGDLQMHDTSSMKGTVEVIVQGKIAMDATAVITTDAWVYSKSSSAPSVDGQWAVALTGNNRIEGSLLVPYGGLVAYNNSYLKGLVYAKFFEIYSNSTLEGTGVFSDVGNFYNNSTIIQNEGILPQVAPQGLSSESVTATITNTYWNETY